MRKLILNEILSDTGSRANGAKLRAAIVEAISTEDTVVLDFADTIITPSFADEAIGLLCKHLTLDEFKGKVRFKNVSMQHKALIFKVIVNRFAPQKRKDP